MNNPRKEDFDKICRSCLNTTSLASIFEVHYEGISLSNILMELSLAQIDSPKHNELPTNLCEICISEVIRFHIFKTNFLKSESTLQDVLKLKETEIVNTISIPDDDPGDELQPPLEDSSTVINLSDASDINSETPNTEELILEFGSDSEDDSLRKMYNIPPEMKIQIINAKSFKKNMVQNGYVFNVKLDGGIQVMTEEELKTPQIYLCMCGKTFNKHPDYLEHKKELQHWRRVAVCNICNKTVSKKTLKLHMRKHTKEKPYVCNFCPMRFSTSGNYKRHLRIHTGEKPYSCDICGQCFNQSTTLNKHKFKHSDICSNGFPSKQHFNTDNNHHSNETIPEIEYSACPVCNKMYTKSSLQHHIARHTNKKKYLCVTCGKQFTTKNVLVSHTLIHTGEKPYVCDICTKCFRQHSSLTQHRLIHTGEKKYICHFCGNGFIQVSHLKRHLTTHTGEKPHECTFCGKRFSIRKNMIVHTRIHTGEKPWVCDVCSKAFYESNALKKHKSVHLKDKCKIL